MVLADYDACHTSFYRPQFVGSRAYKRLKVTLVLQFGSAVTDQCTACIPSAPAHLQPQLLLITTREVVVNDI